MKKKKYVKQALGIAATGIAVGVGAELGGGAAMGTIGSGLKTVGSVASAGMVFDALGQLKPKKKKY